jgi:predicted ATP-grasp superfamily ATP-dependent carboligase
MDPDPPAGSGSVLVLDGYWNKSVAAVRSLGRFGLRVGVGECTRFATAFFSRHCARRFVHPSPVESPDAFVDALARELAGGRYDVVMPMEFSTQQVVTRHRARLSPLARIPFAEPAVAGRLNDKAEVMREAARLGIACPGTFFPSGPDEAAAMAGRLPYPVLVKPRGSSGGRGIRGVEAAGDFPAVYAEVHARYPGPIVQEWLPAGGGALGVAVLMNFDSQPRAAFAYRRLREYPLSGGPGTLRESIDDAALCDTAVTLLAAMGWTGPAMVEFKVDPRDGVPKLLEVNPRFWGSLGHAIACDVDFPVMLYKMAVAGDVAAAPAATAGIRTRSLLHGELMHFLASPDRFRMTPGLLDFSVPDDLLSWDDPMPAFGRVASLLALAGNPTFRRALAG